MNSLEFIEKQIKQCKDFIKTLKRDEKLGFKWENADYKVFEEAITQLQQIKNIIEAWEIAKNKKVDMLDVMYSANAEVYNCSLYKEYKLTEKELETIKKELEVKE